MKTPQIIRNALLLALAGRLGAADPMGTAFTYQGLLTDQGALYTGNAEFQPTP